MGISAWARVPAKKRAGRESFFVFCGRDAAAIGRLTKSRAPARFAGPAGGRSLASRRKRGESSLPGWLKRLGPAEVWGVDATWAVPGGRGLASAKEKTRFGICVSKRVSGFAGILNRNRNRVSRPPAILRVFYGFAVCFLCMSCCVLRVSSTEFASGLDHRASSTRRMSIRRMGRSARLANRGFERHPAL
jgi:hypothetical protein